MTDKRCPGCGEKYECSPDCPVSFPSVEEQEREAEEREIEPPGGWQGARG
jgi:hypothetical protein